MVLAIPSGLLNISRSSDYNSLIDAIGGNGCHNGMTVSANGSGLGVNVAAGAYTANKTKVQYAGATPAVTLSAADATNPRYDIITADSSGTIAAVTGTPAANPAYPAIPANKIRLAIIYVPANLTTLVSGDVYDARIFTLIAKGSATVSSGTSSTTVSDRAVKTASKILLNLRTDANWSMAHAHTLNVPNGTTSDNVGIQSGSYLARASGSGTNNASNVDNSTGLLNQYFWADTINDGTSFKINTSNNLGTTVTIDYILFG